MVSYCAFVKVDQLENCWNQGLKDIGSNGFWTMMSTLADEEEIQVLTQVHIKSRFQNLNTANKYQTEIGWGEEKKWIDDERSKVRSRQQVIDHCS